MQLRLSRSIPERALPQFRRVAANLPLLVGRPVSVSVLPELTAHAGRLLSGNVERGTSVHAAAFIRERRIVLERALVQNPAKLRLIFTHELFHFVWARLGNPRRHEFGQLLVCESNAHAAGALGESSAVERARFESGAPAALWRAFVCESFCDTGAWLYAGVPAHPEFRLAARWSRRRETWFQSTFRSVRSV